MSSKYWKWSIEMTTEREKLIDRLRLGASISRNRNLNLDFADVAEQAAEMLAADGDLRTQLARRTVERDTAINMAADGAQSEPIWSSSHECDLRCEKPEHCRDADQCTVDWTLLAKGGAK